MTNTTVRTLVAVMGALFISGCASVRAPKLPVPFDNDYSPIVDYLSAVATREMKKGGLTGLSIALVDNQELLWSEGFGFADKENKVRATNKTRYRAASVSKLFNAVAVMQKVEQGVLDLDVPIVNYVPNFYIHSRFGSTENITLRNLLTHHSGLPVDHVAGMWSAYPGSLESLLEVIKNDHVAFPANKLMAYSNVGVSLSGLAVQQQSGQAYENYMNDSILGPLQMDDSDFSGHLVGDNASLGYSKGIQVKELPLRDLPAGGLNTTVGDLSNFMIAMLNNGSYKDTRILDSATVEEMLKVQNKDAMLDLSIRMGLGWIYQPKKLNGQFEVVGHNGATMGHSSQLLIVPELGMGVIVMSNSFDFTGANLRIANQALEQLLATRTIPKNDIPANAVVHREFDARPDIEGDYAGSYGLITIKRKNRKYMAKAMKLDLSLTKNDDNWFTPKVKLGILTLPSALLGDVKVTQSIIDGHDVLIAQEEGVPYIVGERIMPVPESAIWNARLGYYKNRTPSESEQLAIDGVKLKKGNGYYVLEVVHPLTGKIELPVQPINDNQLVDLGLGSGLGDTITFSESSGVGTLTMSGRVLELK